MTTTIRPATLADAHSLSELGVATFRDAFGEANRAEDIERYLADAFSPARQAAEIADSASLVLLAERAPATGSGELIGYAHLAGGPPPSAVIGPAPLELKRFYVARAWHGRGIAQRLMDAVLDAARERGAGTLWLGVWEHNPRAVAFYEKYAFRGVGEHAFRLGDDEQTDWLLARPLQR